MNQPSVISLPMDSSTAPTSSEGMSSSVPDASASSSTPASDAKPAVARQHPIPPASEPRQYRAIGLISGVYTPSDEQFTRGLLTTEDGTAIDAVLLGRVMSLIKKHVDLEKPHLWVVYPRTREKRYDLHAQIVGIWEPENLAKSAEEQDEADTEAAIATPATDDLDDGYFSIRGEVLFYSEAEERLIVRIQQSPKKADQPEKAFKLILSGKLEGKTVGYFWDLNVQRQGNLLVVQEGTMIGLVPPRKKKAAAGPRAGGPRPKRPFKKPQPRGEGGAPPPARREPREASAKPTRRVDREQAVEKPSPE
ncbi:hypothetical protein ACQ4M4_06055 [Leptolyngbya sp. AN02str]|uniref:hypothetical protein n=1 Tax=Leptolyngbya sp. AN02str TaxID=3423363 RepID=UPI003D3163C4